MMKELTASHLDERTWQLLSFATSHHRIESEMEKYERDPNRKLYGYVHEDELVGCIGIQLTSSSACEIKHIAVLPSFRGKAIGKQMVEFVISEYRLHRLFAETDMEAVDFYRRLGFSIVSLGEKYVGVERFYCEIIL